MTDSRGQQMPVAGSRGQQTQVTGSRGWRTPAAETCHSRGSAATDGGPAPSPAPSPAPGWRVVWPGAAPASAESPGTAGGGWSPLTPGPSRSSAVGGTACRVIGPGQSSVSHSVSPSSGSPATRQLDSTFQSGSSSVSRFASLLVSQSCRRSGFQDSGY